MGVGSRTLPLQVQLLTIADVKDMVRDHALPMSTKLRLYTDENLVLECQDDASLGGYRALQDGSSLYLAPYGLDFVKLEVQHKTHTSYVTPVDAMGYRTAAAAASSDTIWTTPSFTSTRQASSRCRPCSFKVRCGLQTRSFFTDHLGAMPMRGR